MKKVYLLYKGDHWLSYSSLELIFVGDELDKCYWAAHWKGATNEQIKQLKDIKQTQCTQNRKYEFLIQEWDVNKL